MAVVAKIGAKISAKGDRIVAALAKKLGHSNIMVEVRQKLIAETRMGHAGTGIKSSELPPGHATHEAEGDVIEDVEVCRFGSGSCFVAGTLVSSEHGSRAIETIKQDDLVWSRDAATGKTELKRVKQTFERHSVTLVLTFSNGEKIETTKEHPFYVEHKGFLPAGELGIGTSIVTRAGPSVKLVASSVGKAQKVFNFEVEDFHSYFVGESEAWVHNQCYPNDWVSPRTIYTSSYYNSEGEARALARTMLGSDPVEISPGKWRSRDGKWQYRAKPGDVIDRHVHLEELDPQTGEVLRNTHLRWPEGTGR